MISWLHPRCYIPLASFIHEHIHKVIVTKLFQVVNCVELISAFKEDHSGYTLCAKRWLSVGVISVAAPLISRNDAFKDRSAAIHGSINNSLNGGFRLDTIGTPRLISFLVNWAGEDSNELVAGGRMLVESCLEGFSVIKVDGHFCEVCCFVAQISFLE